MATYSPTKMQLYHKAIYHQIKKISLTDLGHSLKCSEQRECLELS